MTEPDIKIVPWPDAPPKGDAADFFAEKTLDDFVVLLRGAIDPDPLDADEVVPQEVLDNEQADVVRETDVGNSARFARDHRGFVRHAVGLGWLVWDGSRWKRDEGEVEIRRRARDTVRRIREEAIVISDTEAAKRRANHAFASENSHRIDSMLRLAQSERGIATSTSAFDRDPLLFNCLNGTLDLRTGRLYRPRARDLITRLAPVAFDAQAECQTFMKFLDRIFAGDATLIGYVQKATGSSLSGEVRMAALFVAWGSGQNGKSTLLETMRAVMGDYSDNVPASTLMMKMSGGIPNDIAKLRGTRFVTAIESNEGQKLDESMVKSLTGGDTITARFMRQEFFSFQPEFKLWLGTNYKPRISGTDTGIWTRVKLIPFEVTIPPEERDPDLKAKLIAEASGILTWLYQGYRTFMREGLPDIEKVRAAVADYRESQDTLAEFIEDRCIARSGIEGVGLYKSYREWAQENGHAPMSSQTFASRMVARGYKKRKAMRGVAFYGIALREDVTDGQTSLDLDAQIDAAEREVA